MKGRSLSILGIITAAVGAAFILACNIVDMHFLAMACGALFVASGLIDLVIFGAASEKYSRSPLSFISSAAAIMLGVTMLAYADNFVGVMPFMLSILVGAGALWQFITLGLATRPFRLAAWLWVFPMLLTAGAVYIFIIKDSGDDRLLMPSTGIALAVLGVGCIIEGSALGVARRRHIKELAAQQESAAAADTDAAAADSATAAPADASATPETPKADPSGKRVETTEDLDDIVN